MTVTAEYLGFGEDQAIELANLFAASGFEYDYVNDGGVHTLVGTDTSGSVTIDTWEIGAQDEIVSSLKNPLNIYNISDDYLTVIARAVKDGTDILTAGAACAADGSTASTVTSITGNAYAMRLFKRMIGDQTGFFDSKYVLRHTTNVSNRYQANIADFNVNCIYTTAQLLSETQSGGLWIYPLPGRLAYKVSVIDADWYSRYGAESNYTIGWLKSCTTESTAGNNRVNMVTEYKFYRWSSDEYLTAL